MSAENPPAVKPWLLWSVAGVLAAVLGIGGGWLGGQPAGPSGRTTRTGASGACDAAPGAAQAGVSSFCTRVSTS